MRHSKSMQIDITLADAFIFLLFGGWSNAWNPWFMYFIFYTKISNWFEQGLKLLFRCKYKSLETTIYYILLVDNWFKLKVQFKNQYTTY